MHSLHMSIPESLTIQIHAKLFESLSENLLIIKRLFFNETIYKKSQPTQKVLLKYNRFVF